jgi:hypothetical protein
MLRINQGYRRTRLFVLTLGSSRVRLLVFRSSARMWAELHEKAFRRLAGSTRVMVPGFFRGRAFFGDGISPSERRPRGGILRPCRNRSCITFRQFSEGFST